MAEGRKVEIESKSKQRGGSEIDKIRGGSREQAN
jgi:hypothetical protein